MKRTIDLKKETPDSDEEDLKQSRQNMKENKYGCFLVQSKSYKVSNESRWREKYIENRNVKRRTKNGMKYA